MKKPPSLTAPIYAFTLKTASLSQCHTPNQHTTF